MKQKLRILVFCFAMLLVAKLTACSGPAFEVHHDDSGLVFAGGGNGDGGADGDRRLSAAGVGGSSGGSGGSAGHDGGCVRPSETAGGGGVGASDGGGAGSDDGLAAEIGSTDCNMLPVWVDDEPLPLQAGELVQSHGFVYRALRDVRYAIPGCDPYAPVDCEWFELVGECD